MYVLVGFMKIRFARRRDRLYFRACIPRAIYTRSHVIDRPPPTTVRERVYVPPRDGLHCVRPIAKRLNCNNFVYDFIRNLTTAPPDYCKLSVYVVRTDRP